MNASPLVEAAVFLIQTVFGLFIFAVLLRLILQVVRADFHNPLSQAIVKVTNPILVPLRRLIPGTGGFDMASILLIITLKFIELLLTSLLTTGGIAVAQLLMLTLAELLSLILWFFTITIIVQVILSWVNPSSYNPVASLLYSINEPLLGPARRLIPAMGGLDLSPMIVLIIFQLIRIILVNPLYHL